MLNEWVKQTTFTIDVLKSKEEILDENTLQKVFEFTEKAQRGQRENSKTRQKKNFDLLVLHWKHQQNMYSVLSGQKRNGFHTSGTSG